MDNILQPVIALQNTALSSAAFVGLSFPWKPNVKKAEGDSSRRQGLNASVGITSTTFAKQ
jgi:hypothetical protein